MLFFIFSDSQYTRWKRTAILASKNRKKREKFRKRRIILHASFLVFINRRFNLLINYRTSIVAYVSFVHFFEHPSQTL